MAADGRRLQKRGLAAQSDLRNARLCLARALPADMRLALGEYPKVAEALELRPWRYNAIMEEIDRREEAGEMLVIRPPEDPGIGRTEKDPKELERVYRMGREEALKRLEAVKAWISG